MRKNDKSYLVAALGCLLWFGALNISGCEFLDSPFGFVSGCYNYDINWNVFMAPSGLFVLFVAPACVIYFTFRVTQLAFMLIKLVINKVKVKINT